jgi:hypothetical protein
MTTLIALVDALLTADLFPLLVGAGLLVLLARRVAPDQEHRQPSGRLIAAAVFLVYLAAFFGDFLPGAGDGISGVLRGLALAGIAAALAGLVRAFSRALLQRAGGAVNNARRTLRTSGESRREKIARQAREAEAERVLRERQEESRRARELEAPRARRREDARARVEILFQLNAPELGARLTREMFEAFVARYMGDDRPPEYVEARAEQFAAVIAEHLRRVEPPKKSINAILATYASGRRMIEESNLDEEDKGVLLIKLDEQRAYHIFRAIREESL